MLIFTYTSKRLSGIASDYLLYVFRRVCPFIKPGAIWVVGTGEPVARQLTFHTKSRLHNAGHMMQ